MFPRGEGASTGGTGTAYPTQWALNPSAYQGVDASAVDWAALAQRWIQMKDASPLALVPPAPPAPSMAAAADTSDAMELEEPDAPPAPSMSAAQWAGTGAPPPTWGATPGWNQWGWGWGGAENTKADSVPSMPIINYAATETPVPMSGYTTSAISAPSYQSGYWTAPVESQLPAPEVGSRKSYETKSSSRNRRSRDRPSQSVPPPVQAPTPAVVPPTLDAAKRKQLPAWIREGLEKMEREKARAAEREAEAAAAEVAERERKDAEERQLERIRAEGGVLPPVKSKFDTDSEQEASDAEEETASGAQAVPRAREESPAPESEVKPEPLIQRSREEILHEMMLNVRRMLTEILLEVTDHEIHTVSQEELARYTAAQASSLNAVGKSKALSAITSGLGLAAYGSSDSESASEDEPDGVPELTDTQLQEIIRKRRLEFEKTSREIEVELREVEAREAGDEASAPLPPRPTADTSNGEKTNHSSTPDLRQHTHSRHSTTPPPIDREPSGKLTPVLERHHSRDSKEGRRKESKNDKKKLETIYEKPKKSSKRDRTPSLIQERSGTPSKDSESSSSSDSSDDSESSSGSSSKSSSSTEKKPSKKRKRESSSESDTLKLSSKNYKKVKKHSKSSIAESKSSKRERGDYEKSYSKYKNEHREKSSKSSRRNYDEYYEKSHKYEKETKSRRNDDDVYHERSHKRDKESKSRKRNDGEYYDRAYRHEKDSREYDKSHKYRDETEERHRRHKKSRSMTYEERPEKSPRSSEDRRRSEDRSGRRKERRRSRDKSYDRYSSRSAREHGGGGERYYRENEERRSRSRSRGHRR